MNFLREPHKFSLLIARFGEACARRAVGLLYDTVVRGILSYESARGGIIVLLDAWRCLRGHQLYKTIFLPLDEDLGVAQRIDRGSRLTSAEAHAGKADSLLALGMVQR